MAGETKDIVRAYARALLAVAGAEGIVDAVENDLRDVSRAFQDSAQLREFFSNPGVPGANKRAALEQILETKVHTVVAANLGLLVEQGHGRHLPAVTEQYIQEAADVRGRLTAEVTTAVALSPDQEARLREALTKRTGRKITLRTVVDPTIAGGAVLRVGDQIIDGSIRSGIERLRSSLTAG